MRCQHCGGFSGKRGGLLGVSSCSLSGELWCWWFLPDQAWGLLEVFFVYFPFTARFLLPDCQVQPGSGPWTSPAPVPRAICQAVMGEWGEQATPELNLKQGRQQSPSSAGVKPAMRSSGSGWAPALPGQHSAGGLLQAITKVLFSRLHWLRLLTFTLLSRLKCELFTFPLISLPNFSFYKKKLDSSILPP